MNAAMRYSRGTVLVLSLLILLVLTIIGVASISNVFMQERMAGNVNLQSLAFKAASAGVGEALEFGISEINSRGDRIGDCSIKTGNPNDPDRDDWSGPLVEIGTLDMATGALQNVTVHYSLKTDCLKLPPIEAGGPERFESFVTSRGEVRQNGTVLSAREIEVRIDSFRADGLSPVRIEGQAQVEYLAADSNRFTVDGAGGPAISTSTFANASLIADQIGLARIANYNGGVVASQYPPPFNSAEGLAKLVLRIRAYMKHHGVTNDVSGQTINDCSNAFKWRFVEGDLNVQGSPTERQIGTLAAPQITYVTGNLEMAGNASGAGIVIVEGEVDTNGTPDFDGFIIGLGGLVDMQGGGEGTTNGMLFATNLDLTALVSQLVDLMDYPGFVGSTDNWFARQNIDNSDPANPVSVLVPGIYNQLMALPLYDPGGVTFNYPASLGVGTNSLPSGSDVDGFGKTTLRFDGGGSHSILYDCHKVEAVRNFLKTCQAPDANGVLVDALLVDDWPSFECDLPGRGGIIEAIISWRENLGWREAL